jgi:hypothetical protein
MGTLDIMVLTISTILFISFAYIVLMSLHIFQMEKRERKNKINIPDKIERQN